MVGDRVTVTFGAQKFSPVQYHVLDIGPFSMETTVQKGETDEQAMERAYRSLAETARQAFKREMPPFLERVKEAATAAGRR